MDAGAFARISYISCWLVRVLVRVIARFKTDEAKVAFAQSLLEREKPAPGGGASPFRVIHELSLVPIVVLEPSAGMLDDQAIEALLPESEGIVAKEREAELFLSASSPNTILDMDTVNSSVYGPFQGNGLAIAVIDGGILATHPDLAGCEISRREYVAAARGLDAGHGTAVAGIICGSGRMSRGRFKGIAREVELLDCVAFDARGRGLLGDVLAAVDGAVGAGIRVVCMPFSSWPGTEPSTIFEHYLRVLVEAHSVVFCSGAGNSGPLQGTIGMPGRFDCVLTAGSTSPDFKVSRFSGRGSQARSVPKPDFCLPGEQAVSLNAEDSLWKERILDENEHYAVFSGNSVSVAILTGLVAGILSAKPDARPSAIKQLLTASCKRMRKFAPLSAGKGIVVASSIFRNMDVLYAFAKRFPVVAHDAAFLSSLILFFSITTALLIASLLS
ncbi:MAG: S8 family serine peptidase [Candidatus Lokiarchaeota archaeon]|nr:S8 family serine peptidase [Candidatus Lokiarchaeota archaeon]